ncbi:MAG: hypothetical protein ACI4KF_09205 [Huintestinicola sp.]
MEDKKSILSVLLSLDFIFGAGVFIYAAAHSRGIGTVGFIILAVFSLMSAVGVGFIDLSFARYFRTSTKVIAAADPFLIFLSSLLGIIMAKSSSGFLVPVIIIGCVASSVMSVMLYKRYREDDF